MNLPEPERTAYFEFWATNAALVPRNLNHSSFSMQWSHVRSRIDIALVTQADTWIFHPCVGISPSLWWITVHSPIGLVSQPAGSSRPSATRIEPSTDAAGAL